MKEGERTVRPETVVSRGAGELATGIAHRLRRSGFPVVMLELPQPTVERRTVALAEAVYEGEVTVEGVRGIRIEEPGAVQGAWARGAVPVLVDPEARCLGQLRPTVLVDAIMAKMNVGTRRDLAPVVIGVGPGFVAGLDADAVVETQCGHYLGRVIYRGAADPHTGVPGEILGYSEERVLRVPPEAAGRWEPNVEIGHKVSAELTDPHFFEGSAGFVRVPEACRVPNWVRASAEAGRRPRMAGAASAPWTAPKREVGRSAKVEP